MSESEKHSSDEWLESTPPELKESAKEATNNLLPLKSSKLYESTYELFVKWKREQKTKLTTESVILEYFTELSKKYKPSTLWATYSMLKAMLKIKEQVDFDTYYKFKAFLKKQSSGYTSKKSNVLSSENVRKFLSEAPDDEYLAMKVALIFGITGACRSRELVNMKLRHVKRQGDVLVVDIPSTKLKQPRTFVVLEEFTKTVQKYIDLRPSHAITTRFFLNLRKGKCTNQVIGIHTFARMPKQIAIYLNLNNPESYTGHAFRRTSATLFADSKTNIITLKHHDGWKSSTVAKESNVANTISTAVDLPPVGSSAENTDAQRPKRRKMNTVTSEPFTFVEVKSEPFTSEDITSEEITFEAITSQLVKSETVTSEAVTFKQAASETVTSEKQISSAQEKVNKNSDSSTKPHLIFHNCTFIIHTA